MRGTFSIDSASFAVSHEAQFFSPYLGTFLYLNGGTLNCNLPVMGLVSVCDLSQLDIWSSSSYDTSGVGSIVGVATVHAQNVGVQDGFTLDVAVEVRSLSRNPCANLRDSLAHQATVGLQVDGSLFVGSNAELFVRKGEVSVFGAVTFNPTSKVW